MAEARQAQPYSPPDRLVGEAERRLITGYSRQFVVAARQEGKVPRRIQLGTNKVGWLESELLAWMADLRDRAAPEAEPCRPAG